MGKVFIQATVSSRDFDSQRDVTVLGFIRILGAAPNHGDYYNMGNDCLMKVKYVEWGYVLKNDKVNIDTDTIIHCICETNDVEETVKFLESIDFARKD